MYNSRLNLGKGPMKKKILIVLVLALFALPGILFARDVLEEVKALPIVKSLLPAQVQVIEARDLGSLFELVAQEPMREKQIFYVTKDGEYLIAGSLINKDKVNLTQERSGEVNRVDMSKVPLKDALQIKKGNGAKKLIMFTDVDCPFCRKAYDWLKGQTDYTLYIFFFPLDIHPKSPGKTVQIFCSKNQETALENAQSDKEIDSQKCEAGAKMLARHKAIAGEVGVDGTPLFLTDSGKRMTGLQVPALTSYLKN